MSFRKVMWWQVPNIWRGGDAWVIGGGSSIIEQFEIPVEIVEKVRKGEESLSAYSPYMKVIHGKHVIGVNVAFMLGDWIDFMFFGDNNFYLKYRHQMSQFHGLKITCNHLSNKFKWIKCLQKDRQVPRGLSTNPKALSWNGNSGAAAINLAVHFGAKRIYLLGFDMKLDEDKNQHWHKEYSKQGKMVKKNKLGRVVRVVKTPFEGHLKCFPKVAEMAKKRGIEIINVCPDSVITQFPKMTLKEALNGT